MDPNNGDSSKREGKNVVEEMGAPADPNPIRFVPAAQAPPNYPMHEQPRPHLPSRVSTTLCLGTGSSQNTQNNNANTNAGPNFPSAAIRPPLYTLLPTFVEPPERLPNFLRQQNRHVDQRITAPMQGNQLRPRMAEAAEDMAARRLRDSEEQLSLIRSEMRHVLQRAQAFTEENRVLRRRITELEQRVTELTHEEEDAESASVDPNRLEPIMLECKICVRRRASVMLWPCRHVCVCHTCELATRRCPVCGLAKDGSFGVILPPR